MIFGKIIRPPRIISAADKIDRVFNTLSEIVPTLPNQYSNAVSGLPNASRVQPFDALYLADEAPPSGLTDFN
ncbi:MAG: hypothetical protein CMQ16_11300 [Gammaproteobacteria bacterium]|nr:hypothetical protein [Gammaproteobacteria bacterium]